MEGLNGKIEILRVVYSYKMWKQLLKNQYEENVTFKYVLGLCYLLWLVHSDIKSPHNP